MYYHSTIRGDSVSNWINETVAIYSSRLVVETLFRLFVFILLMLGGIVAKVRLIKNISQEVKDLQGKKISVDRVISSVIIAICILLTLVVATLGIMSEVLTLKQIL